MTKIHDRLVTRLDRSTILHQITQQEKHQMAHFRLKMSKKLKWLLDLEIQILGTDLEIQILQSRTLENRDLKSM